MVQFVLFLKHVPGVKQAGSFNLMNYDYIGQKKITTPTDENDLLLPNSKCFTMNIRKSKKKVLLKVVSLL